MKTARKAMAVLMVLATLLAFAACTGQPDTPTDPTSEPTPTASPTTDGNALSLTELGERLASTPYQIKDLVCESDCGLTSTAVGVDKDKFDADVEMYPFPADSEFAVIVNLADKGVSENNSADDNVKAFKKALFTLTRTQGKKKIVIPNGNIKLSEAISLTCDDLYICGSGDTHLIYTNWTGAFVANACRNIHLSHFDFTYETPGMLTGTIKNYNPNTHEAVIQMTEKFDITNPCYDQVRGIYEMKKGEDGRYRIDLSANLRYWLGDTFTVKNARERTIKVTYSGAPASTPKEGTVVSILLGCYQGSAALGGTNVTDFYLEDVHGDTLPGMGLVLCYCENAYVNRFVLSPDTSRDLYFSTCWDGIHTVNLAGDFKLTNSMIDAPEDDCLNVCAEWLFVTGGSGKNLTVRPQNANLQTSAYVAVGDVIEIYDNTDFAPLGTYTVVSLSGNTLGLDKALESGVSAGHMIGVASRATHLTIDNCIFANGIGHAGLIQCRDTKITNSYASNLSMGGFRVHSSQYVYYEAILPRNIEISNCKFSDCGFGNVNYYAAIEVMAFIEDFVTTPGVLKQVKIENNFFTAMRGGSVIFYGVGDSSISHNFCYDICRNAVRGGNAKLEYSYNTAFGVTQSRNVTVSDNVTYMAATNMAFSNVKVDKTNTTDVSIGNNTLIKK